MTEFWKEHSVEATVEEMMLDSSAQQISQHEIPEILSTLPKLGGMKVLELGAGIGRYTKHLVKVARHVTAVDFMQKFLDKNKEDNGHYSNVDFLQADVTCLQFPDNRYACLQISNRDTKRSFNPTKYRTPADYNHLLMSVVQENPMGGEQCFGFEIAMTKSVQTYIKEFVDMLNLQPGQRVLDVGCGIGGGDFYMAKLLEEAGFQQVHAEDRTAQFVQVLKEELQKFEDIRDEFIEEFLEEDYNDIIQGWNEKLKRCELGDQRWGLFYAEHK
ncbi:PEAM3 methyltransferase, partial [Polypterus senegalus]